jgi:hypothetical protein
MAPISIVDHRGRAVARVSGFVCLLLVTTISGCGGQGQSVHTGSRQVCSPSLESCDVGDTGIGGGIVFSVSGTGPDRVVLEYAPAGWSGTSNDPPLDWESAKRAADGYRSGDAHAWRLPSKDELKALFAYWKESGDGGLSASLYWSSSAWGGGSAWYLSFDDGAEYHSFRESTNFVRPVRSDS